MTNTELLKAVKILKAHNLYRRDRNVPSVYPMGDPTELGIAIDVIVEWFEINDKETR
jgi:hypothetical protein